LGRPWAWQRQGGPGAAPGRDGPDADRASRVFLLLGGMAGAVVLVVAWGSALAIMAEDRALGELAAQSRAMAAARVARDALPRALEPAERVLSALQSRANAQARGERWEVEAVEKNLLGAVQHGQDGVRAVAASDANGVLTWQPQPGALQPWLGGSGFFLAHRQGRMAPILSPLSGGGVVLSARIVGPAGGLARGGFAGLALALIDPQRLAQALPGAGGPGEPHLLLFDADGVLLASGHGVRRLERALPPDPLPDGHAERSVIRRGGEHGRVMAVASVQVPGFGLIVQSSVEDVAAGDAANRLGLLVYGLATAISCVVALGLIWLFGRVLREDDKVVGHGPGHVDLLGGLADVTRGREGADRADDAGRIAAARGVMAAGLAHELNQPLAVMALAAENALEALEEGEAGIPSALLRLRRISAQAERAKAIAAQLRSFGRLEAAVLEPVCLADAVRGALGLVGGMLGEAGIEVALRMAPGLAAVRGQPLLIEQLVVNLALNARDAMAASPEGQRRLSIIGEPGLEAHEVRLVVRDTGGGIPAEALERVFDPFFSTKPASKGTGLGLALCRSIMLRFGGHIGLSNLAHGQGAEAVLTFQRARQKQAV